MSFASDKRIADSFNAERDTDRMACSICGASTPRATLSEYGARCRPCFDAYCNEAPGKPIRNPREALRQLVETLGKGHGAIGTQWAYRLRDRHEAGEVLSRFQIDCYTRAIGAAKKLSQAVEGAEVQKDEIDKALRATGDLPSAQFEPWWTGLDIPAFEAEA